MVCHSTDFPSGHFRRPERSIALTAGPVRCVCQGAPSPRTARPNGLADVRGRVSQPGAVCRALRRVPRCARGGLKDLPGSFRQEQVLHAGARGRATGGDPRLCRSDRVAPGRPDCRRSRAANAMKASSKRRDVACKRGKASSRRFLTTSQEARSLNRRQVRSTNTDAQYVASRQPTRGCPLLPLPDWPKPE